MAATGHASPRCMPTEGGYREREDDFFCLRFGVWYASFDCAIRTHFDTAPGCRNCDQGRFNHRRHRATIRPRDYRLPVLND